MSWQYTAYAGGAQSQILSCTLQYKICLETFNLNFLGTRYHSWFFSFRFRFECYRMPIETVLDFLKGNILKMAATWDACVWPNWSHGHCWMQKDLVVDFQFGSSIKSISILQASANEPNASCKGGGRTMSRRHVDPVTDPPGLAHPGVTWLARNSTECYLFGLGSW